MDIFEYVYAPHNGDVDTPIADALRAASISAARRDPLCDNGYILSILLRVVFR